jgi:hypothetical protein
MALPLASYYTTTLALPLANGAAQSGAFFGHALVVLIVPPVVIVLACTVPPIAHALVRACRAAGAALRPLRTGALAMKKQIPRRAHRSID